MNAPTESRNWNLGSDGLKIAIAVHGRFHGFDLARELLRRGHNVTLLTNYPAWAVARFGIPRNNVQSLWPHGVLSRGARRLYEMNICPYPEQWLHEWFGRWAASKISKETWDVVVCWSGIGWETFQELNPSQTLRICMRGSAHIRAQARLIEEERGRTGEIQDCPSDWTISREEREYNLADWIMVPSTFAWRTFTSEGVAANKITTLPLGVNTQGFRSSRDIIEARCARMLSEEPLRILNVGTFSYRKGMLDTAAVVKQLGARKFQFRFVGPIAPETSALVKEMSPLATFISKRPQHELPLHYAWGDLFILPTIEDGFQMVLAQASAAGLPILTTPNGAGEDLVGEGKNGWLLPIRAPDAFVERLQWCDQHRKELAHMVRRIHEQFKPRDWAEVAADFEALCLKYLDGPVRKASADGR